MFGDMFKAWLAAKLFRFLLPVLLVVGVIVLMLAMD